MAAKESKTRGGAKETVALHGGGGGGGEKKLFGHSEGVVVVLRRKLFGLGGMLVGFYTTIAATAATAGKENRMRALLFPSFLPLI